MEADYAMLSRLGNLPCFLPIESFLNFIEPDAFKDKLEIFFTSWTQKLLLFTYNMNKRRPGANFIKILHS